MNDGELSTTKVRNISAHAKDKRTLSRIWPDKVIRTDPWICTVTISPQKKRKSRRPRRISTTKHYGFDRPRG